MPHARVWVARMRVKGVSIQPPFWTAGVRLLAPPPAALRVPRQRPQGWQLSPAQAPLLMTHSRNRSSLSSGGPVFGEWTALIISGVGSNGFELKCDCWRAWVKPSLHAQKQLAHSIGDASPQASPSILSLTSHVQASLRVRACWIILLLLVLAKLDAQLPLQLRTVLPLLRLRATRTNQSMCCRGGAPQVRRRAGAEASAGRLCTSSLSAPSWSSSCASPLACPSSLFCIHQAASEERVAQLAHTG